MDQGSPRYKILRPLGRGAFGVVFLAHDNILGRDIALKVLDIPEGSDDAETKRHIDMFQREARAAASLSHPNIVIVYDISRTQDKHFISMEFVEGVPLSEVIPGPLLIDQILMISRQVLWALGYAHEHGVIHRDVKPGNIFVLPDGSVKLMDFGLAIIQSVSAQSSTGTMVGSPGYIAPEVFEGKTADARTDIFSFGVVLYEMLTGKRPFGPDSDYESDPNTMFQVLSTEQDPPSSLNLTIPRVLDEIVQKCLQKDPDNRYQSISDLLKELVPVDFPSIIEPEPDHDTRENSP